MTTYSEERCPWPNDCPDPDHKHSTPNNDTPEDKRIEEILERFHHDRTVLDEDPRYTLEDAKQAIRDLLIGARRAEHLLWKPVAEEIVAKDGVYRAVNYLNKRAQELQQLTSKGE